ncbi:sensor histidine kinase [Tahibacter harae]|uniref:histidine kinase n=1 Tax=Tahibacter harae TaxID=2963937 RepID=A0ABT1QW97_9GAMM|nr:HAMP domain-containing sensor histidine kinase [Tahibacter harae]MCQ4166564.1 HAMP domain-containing histidine kinase [Tahibacter harae]
MSTRPRRLQRRLMGVLALFTLAVAGLFGLYAMAFMYATEDAFFSAMLQQEAAAQYAARERSGRWSTPAQGFMHVYENTGELPDGLDQLLAAEPQRHELPGRDGRHYHLLALHARDGARAWLAAEVSSQLVVRPRRQQVLGILAWSALGLIVLALLLGYLLARRTTAPLARLVGRVDGISAQHWPQDLAQGFRDDEVGALARALQALLRRLHAFVEREREFTRDASHELRTPLSVIRTAAESLQNEALSAVGRQQLQHLHQSALQLQQTVTTLLTLAREEETSAATAAPAPLLPLLERVIVEQAPLLDGKPVEVHLDIAPALASTVPASVLHILLSNLIGNAFAHAEDGAVEIGSSDGRLHIANRAAVLDSAAAQRLVDEPYARREGSAGFGLGLVIVRRLGERFGLDLRISLDEGAARASFRLTPGTGGTGAPPPAAE